MTSGNIKKEIGPKLFIENDDYLFSPLSFFFRIFLNFSKKHIVPFLGSTS